MAVTPDTKTEGDKTVTTATVGADKVDSIKDTISNADGDEGAPINVSVDVSGESADEANVNLSKEVVGALVEAAAKDLDGKATERCWYGGPAAGGDRESSGRQRRGRDSGREDRG